MTKKLEPKKVAIIALDIITLVVAVATALIFILNWSAEQDEPEQ